MRRKDAHYRLVLFERLAEEFGECSHGNPDWQPDRMPRKRTRFESVIGAFIDAYGGNADSIKEQIEAATSTTRHAKGPASYLMQTKIDAYRAGMIDCTLAFGTRMRKRPGATPPTLPTRAGKPVALSSTLYITETRRQ